MSSELLTDAQVITMELFEGRSVLVESWNEGSALRRAVYRYAKKLAPLYGDRELRISARKENSSVLLTADLTSLLSSDRLLEQVKF